MELERFNAYGKTIKFEPVQGIWIETARATDEPINGIGDLVNHSCVALVRRVDGLDLYIGQSRFSLDTPETALDYRHNGDGTTTFSARDPRTAVEVVYKSWWLAAPQDSVVFGAAADEDEDFCAYIIFMTSAAGRKARLLKNYVAPALSLGSGRLKVAYFSDRDLRLVEALQYDPDLSPSYEFIKSCLVWKDEVPDNLTPDGYSKLCDLLIARSFIHKGKPFSSFPLSSTRFENVWTAVHAANFNWPGFNRMSLSVADQQYLHSCLAAEDEDGI